MHFARFAGDILAIDDFAVAFVAAGNQGAAAVGAEARTAAVDIGLAVAEQAGFAGIGRDDIGVGEQVVAQRLTDAVVGERAAAGRAQHGIHHQRHVRQAFGQVDDAHHLFGVGNDADLDGGEVHIGQRGLEAAVEKIRRHRFDAMDVGGVLTGQQGDHGGCMGAVRRSGFDVGLNTGAAAGIVARNDQNIGTFHGRRVYHRRPPAAGLYTVENERRRGAVKIFQAPAYSSSEISQVSENKCVCRAGYKIAASGKLLRTCRLTALVRTVSTHLSTASVYFCSLAFELNRLARFAHRVSAPRGGLCTVSTRLPLAKRSDMTLSVTLCLFVKC